MGGSSDVLEQVKSCNTLMCGLGLLAYVTYYQIVAQLPLPVAPFLAFTVFLPGFIGHVVVASIFRSQTAYEPFLISTYVSNPYTESLGAVISVLFGLALACVFWRMYRLSSMS